MAREPTTIETQPTTPNTVPCAECGATTIPQTDTTDKSICLTCIPAPGESPVEQQDSPAEVPCSECGEPTETSAKVPVSICQDCIQKTAAEAGF